MELVGPIFEVVKCFGASTCRYIDHHRKLEQHLNDLRGKVNDLNIRKGDLELQKEEEIRRGKVVKGEVEKWFEDIREVNTEMEKIEQKFLAVSYFSRGRLGKSVCRMIEEVKEIHQRGSFTQGLAIDGPPAAGVTLPITNLEGEIVVKERIWEYLMGDEVRIIGVCGMGGIGKTTVMKHINNQLLKETRFDKVIWVTVSRELNIFKLQEDIANSMKQSLPKNELERAATLKNILEGMRYVLILDDVWKRFSLLDVGIPEPIPGKGMKVVLTSRSVDICKSMGCEVVKMQPLSENESMKLFLDHVGHNVLQNPNLGDIVKKIVEECGGLPLSIVTMGSSMKGVNDIGEWRNALYELKERVKSVKGMDIEIYERLKFSYDRLEDLKIKNCFLYCSLYPEDFGIEKAELIENWIDEGLLDDLKTRQAMFDRGHSILSRLENNCLLEGDEKIVKMHDVLRDMALYIKGNGDHQFMVKAGMSLEELPGEHEWTVNLEKVSLMGNYYYLKEIPSHISPRCPYLSTLILRRNFGFTSIPDSFFEHMPGLKVLDLSETWITALPNSISKLKNLHALVLAECCCLSYLPSLAELKALRKLDLFRTVMEEVPHGIDLLENLTLLRLSLRSLKVLPVGILSKISHLQCLVIEGLHLTGEEVGKLRKLEIISCEFPDLQELEIYAKSIQGKWPTNFYFQLGSSGTRLSYFQLGSSGTWLTDSPSRYLVQNLKELQKEVKFLNLTMEKIDDIVVANELLTLGVEKCDDFKCLSHIPFLHKATGLKRCEIRECRGIECVIDLSSSSFNPLQNIEELELEGLNKLHEIVREGGVAVESTSHAPTPLAIFSSLKVLKLYNCSTMKALLSLELVQGLQNLEEMKVLLCAEMEKIIASSEEEENHKGELGTTFINLPKLKSFYLSRLPNLKSICGREVMIHTDSLQYLLIYDCPKLKRIPLALPLLENGQPSPPSLHKIKVRPREWWESVQWDDPQAKQVLSPFVSVSNRPREWMEQLDWYDP